MTGASSLAAVRALICEDEPLARRAIREYLSDVDWVEIVGEAKNGKEAMRLIHKLEPDLVFMDVRMPGLTGIEVVDAVTHRSAVVFTTAHDEYAVAAFELGAVDYLVKPFGRERLLATLSRVRVRLIGEGGGRIQTGNVRRDRPADRIFARRKGAMVPLRAADIVRIDATTGGAEAHTSDATFDLDATLGEIEERLDPSDFVRVHRSHIVNLAHVEAIAKYDERRLEIRLADGSSLVASRQGSKTLRSLIS